MPLFMVILSAVIGSVVSEVGLGSQPAFKVPEYDFRSVFGFHFDPLRGLDPLRLRLGLGCIVQALEDAVCILSFLTIYIYFR